MQNNNNIIILLVIIGMYILGVYLGLTSLPEPVVDTTPIIHVEKPLIIKPITYDKKAIATAYTLSRDETDGSPEIGSNNHNLKEFREKGVQVCASRSLPMHTIIDIEGFGKCEILDRTSKKYSGRIDILMSTKAEAIKFGKREVRYRVIN